MRYALLLAAPLAALSASAGAVEIAPMTQPVDVNGVAVQVTLRGDLKPTIANRVLTVRAEVVIDLADLQAKLGQIVATFPLPRDNCASFKPDNIVASLSEAGIGAREGAAIVVLKGNVEIWTCLENPVPKTKVEMQVKDVGFGIKTKVPVVITWPGDPLKTRLASQSFTASVPFLLRAQGESVGIEPGQPSIDLTGQYASITEGLLSIAGVNINDFALAALQKAIDWSQLRACFPQELAKLNPQFEEAEFAEVDGRLMAKAVVTGRLESTNALDLYTQLNNADDLSFDCT